MSWWVQNHFRWVWISSVHSLISTTFIDYQIKDQPIFIVNGSFEKSLLTWAYLQTQWSNDSESFEIKFPIIHMNIKFVFHPNWINILWFQKSCSSSLHFKSHLTNSLIMSVNEERKGLARMIMNLEIKDHSFSSIKADWFQCWVLDSFWSTSKVPISNWNIKSKNAKRSHFLLR